MALSGTIAWSNTAQQLIDAALRKITVLGEGESASGNQYADAQQELNYMLGTWSQQGPNLWTITEGTAIPLISGTATYTLSPRPRSVATVRFAVNDVEQRPMTEWDRQDWDRFPQKAQTGAPLKYLVDRQRTSTTLTFWPIPNQTGVWTAPYSYERVFQDVTQPSQDIDVPQEWLETVMVNLASRLADDYRLSGPNVDRVRDRAMKLYDMAMTADRRGDVRIRMGGY